MKKLLLIWIFFFTNLIFSQYKNSYDNKLPWGFGISNGQSSFLSSFNMRHSYSLTYSSLGKNSFAIQAYTNTISFNLSDNLSFEMDASIVNMPYSTLGRNFQNYINGIYLTRAQLNYKISEKSNLQIQFNNKPFILYDNYFYDRSFFLRQK